MNRIKIALFSLSLLFGCSSDEKESSPTPPPPTPTPPPFLEVDLPANELSYNRFILCDEKGVLEERVFNKNESQYIHVVHEGLPEPIDIRYSWRNSIDEEISRNSFLLQKDVEGLYSVYLFTTTILPNAEEVTQRHEPIKIEPHEIFLDIKEILNEDSLLIIAYNSSQAKRMGISPESYDPLRNPEHAFLAIEPEFNGEMAQESMFYAKTFMDMESTGEEYLIDGDDLLPVVEAEENIVDDYGQKLSYEWYVDGILIPNETTYRYPLFLWPAEGSSLKVIIIGEEFVPFERVIQSNRSLSDS